MKTAAEIAAALGDAEPHPNGAGGEPPTDPADIAEILGDAEPYGNGWRCRCPICNEICLSLWDGWLLDKIEWHCFGVPGCNDSMVGNALRLRGLLPSGNDDEDEEEEEEEDEPEVTLFDQTTLHGKPVPQHQWLVGQWIPMARVTALYGAGGEGKTLLAQMLATCGALGKNWLGLPTRRPFRSILFFAEDDLDEMPSGSRFAPRHSRGRPNRTTQPHGRRPGAHG